MQANRLLTCHVISLLDVTMCANTLNELFEVGLKEMYYNEQQLVDALKELESTTDEAEIQEAFSEHRTETERHAERLEGVFEMMDASPETKLMI
jgi:ferritin-like metal-binding protein YciE